MFAGGEARTAQESTATTAAACVFSVRVKAMKCLFTGPVYSDPAKAGHKNGSAA